MKESERAARLVHDLDQRLQNQQAYTEQTLLEDRPLLEIADHLSRQAPFSPTSGEHARLRSRFDRQKTWQHSLVMRKPLPGILKPTLNVVLWAAILIGVFAITVVLISNLLGQPAGTPAGPAPTGAIPAITAPSATATPQPVPINLEQALALIQNPTWSSVFFEYQTTSHGKDGKDHTFYKQVWMDRENHGRVISSDQVESAAPRAPENQPTLLFISEETYLKAIGLPSGVEIPGFDRSPWSVSPLENAGEGIAKFFARHSGIDQTGALVLEPFVEAVAGRPAFVIRGDNTAFWYDLETGLLLRKEQSGAIEEEISVRVVAYNVPLPAELDDAAGLEQIRFVDTPPASGPDTSPPEIRFPVQTQTVDGTRIELREVAAIGSSLRATLCYPPPGGDGTWRLDGVELKVGENVLPFYPSSSQPAEPGEDGLACETFTAAQIGVPPVSAWTVTVGRLIAPRETALNCEKLRAQLESDLPGVELRCDPDNASTGYSFKELPEGMNHARMRQLVNTYIDSEVLSGPWSFAFNPSDILYRIPSSIPSGNVVMPIACDPYDPRAGLPIANLLPPPTGVAGGGTLQSGQFTLAIDLICDPAFSRLKAYGNEHSEINGLGVRFSIQYQGETTGEGVAYFSGVWPFIMHGGGGGSLGNGDVMADYGGLLFPENTHPDFTQTDVRLRYPVRVRLPDGSVEGAALAFTLQRVTEGYRPIDVLVEPLTEAERQNAEINANPSEPLPFPTLPVPETPVAANTQALYDLLDRWEESLLSTPGWLHMRTRTEIPGGNDLYAGLTEYINDDWYQVDQQGLAVTHIHIDHRLDGTVLQQAYSHNGKTVNLTFGDDGGLAAEFKPYRLDLANSPRDALKMGEQVQRLETTIDGRPVILLVVPGGVTRREAVDATSGAWLYSEMVRLQEGDDPLTGGSLDNRTTIEAAERVDAPPQEALALLGKEFTGYIPPAPYGTPAPQGFDPSKEKISMQVVNGDGFPATTFWYGDLYSNGYLLGRVDFGGIPGGFCDRSADGSKLAFNYTQNEDNGSVTGNSLRWFDIRDLKMIHQPAPEIVNIGVLSWATSGEKLAVFGCKTDQKGCGMYLLDPATDQLQMLLPDVYASGPPIWNLDGSQIAFVDTLADNHTLYVFDIHSGMIVYQGNFDVDAWQVPADSPTNDWGVTFPRGLTGSRCFDQQ